MKKLISLLLCIMLVVTMIPGMAFAEGQLGPEVGDIALYFDMPSNVHAWVPGQTGTITTFLEQYAWHPENGDTYWDYVSGYALDVVAYDSESGTPVELAAVSGTNININVPIDCQIGSTIILKLTGSYDGKTVEETTQLDILETSYTIESSGLPSKPGLGETVDFNGHFTATKHFFVAADGEKGTPASKQAEAVENPVFEVDYNWNRTDWEPVTVNDPATNGLIALKRVNRDSVRADVRLLNDRNDILAEENCEFGWLELGAQWNEIQNGTLRIFNDSTDKTFTLNKTSDLSASPEAEIEFVLGIFVNNSFEPFTEQENLFDYVLDGDIVTGMKLNISELVEIADYDDNGDFWFGVETRIKNGTEIFWNDGRGICLSESVSEYRYQFDEQLIMLPGNGNGTNRYNSVEYYVRNSNNPNGSWSPLEITDAVSSNPSVVTVTANGNNWDINAVALGQAFVTLTHADGNGGTKTVVIEVDVREERWNYEFDSASGTDDVFPGGTLNYTLYAEHWIYNSSRDENVWNENANYSVNWSYVNSTDEGFALLKPSADTKSLTIEVAPNAEERKIPVKYQIFDMNSADTEGNHPVVGEGIFNFWITSEYHTFDVAGFKSDLAVGETITVTLEMVKHKLVEGTATHQPVPATFVCDSYDPNTLEVTKDETVSTATKAVFTIKRIGTSGTDLHFTSFFGDGSEWGRGYGIHPIDMGGNEDGRYGQIYWVEANNNNPSDDLRNWNNWFSENKGTELTVKFAVEEDGQIVYLEDVHMQDQYSHVASIEKVADYTFKLTFKEPGEFRLYADINDTRYEMSGQTSGAFYAYTKKANGDGSFEFERMEVVPSYNGLELAEFYANQNNREDKEAPDEFYVLWPTDDPDAPRPELKIFKIEGFSEEVISNIPAGETGITISSEDNHAENGQTYLVWKLTVGKQFDMARVGIKIENIPEMKDYTYFLWVLGETYFPLEEWYCYDGIFAVADLPEAADGQVPTWANLKALDKDLLVRPDGEHMPPEINMNMSVPSTDERNTFYIVRRADENTSWWMDLSQVHAFHFGGTALGFGGGGQFEKLLNNDETVDLSNPIAVKIGNEEYEAIKVTLKNYLGHSNLIIAMGNDDDEYECMRAKITFGMDVYLTGDTEGIKGKIRDSHNILHEVLGFNPVTADFDFVDYGNGVVKAYFDKACAVFSEKGQGMQCGLDIELKPGYVVTDIKERVFSGTSTAEQNCSFIVNNIYYYDVYNGNTKLDTDALLDTVGWGLRIGSEENNVHKAACFSSHTVAAYGYEDAVGEETVNDFNNFLNGDNFLGAKLKAKKVDAYTDYTVHFNKENVSKQCAIVLNIENPDDFNGSKVDVHGKNNVKVDKVDNVEFSTKDNNKVNNNLAQLEGDDLEVKTVYNIQVEDHEAGDGIVVVTIPESELDGRDLSEYKVVYFDENGVPMEMQTTYIEGKGLVFTTGHFSTYAVIGPKGSGNTGGESGGSIGGGYVPSTPKDPVTNQTGTATAAPSTNADMSQSTTVKGGETTTTVDQTTADKIVDKAVENKSEEIVIDATYKKPQAAHSTKSATVELPADALQQIAEKTDADVTIKTDVAEVKMDNAAAAAIAEQTAGTRISLVAEKVKDSAKEVRVELKFVSSEGKIISDFNGGTISVTVEVPKNAKNVICVYIDEQGHMHKVPGQLNADGTYTFTTGHFSTYAVMAEEDADAAIAEQKAAVKEIKFKLKSKLVTTKKGKKAVKLIWDTRSDLEFDGVAIYRSTKKNSGYGKKPFFTTTKDSYTNTAVKAGKKYYYKVRGFVIIDGEKVYTDYSTKAWRTVK